MSNLADSFFKENSFGIDIDEKAIQEFFSSNSLASYTNEIIKPIKTETKEKEMISTPGWWTNRQFDLKSRVPWEKKQNVMFNQHFRLEVIERRINDGKIPETVHSAVAPLYERNVENLQITTTEKKLQTSYKMQTDGNVKPLFWCDRVYDNKFRVLDTEETRSLIDKIEKIDKVVPIEEFYEPTNTKKKCQRKSEDRFCVTFASLDFDTENDDDQTQWEDEDM